MYRDRNADIEDIAREAEVTDRVIRSAAKSKHWPDVTKHTSNRAKLTRWADALCKGTR